MADILLSVGLQTGAAETSEFVSQLQGIVNSINGGENTVIKMRPVIDSAGFNELKTQLSSIGSMIEQINQKNFNLNLNLDDSQSVREHLGQYQEQIREYVRNVQDAYSVIGQVTKSSPIREMGTEATQYIAPAIAAIEKYGDAVGKLETRLDRTSSAAGAERIATDAQKMYSAIQPLIELARDKGVLSFGEDDFKLPAMMEEANGSAGTLRSNLDSIASSLQILSSNIDSVASGFSRMNDGGSSGSLHETKAEANEVAAAFRELKNIQSQINTKDLQLIKLDPDKNAAQIAEIKNQLSSLKQEYDNLYSANKDKLSSAQLEQLARGFEQAAAKARELKAAMEDKANAKTAADAYRAEADALRDYEQNINNVFNRLKSLQSQIGKKEIQLVKLDPQKNAAQIAEIESQLRSLRSEYENLLSTNKENLSEEQLKILGQRSEETKEKIRELIAIMKDLDGQKGPKFNDLESRFARMLSVSAVVMQIVKQLKAMIKTTIELDTAMTQLRVVTDESEDAYSKYSSTVAKTAQEIGASATDLINSATVFARLGYSLDESGTLAKYTAMLANVGDIDVSSAQSALTAITKAYGISADQIESVMDKMVSVGNNFPISVSEIAEGMNNAGSALAAAGNSFEESVALLTAANTTIQNINKSSTGLRTITARIRKTDLELNELGEAIETSKYEEAIAILTKYKVALTDNGEYRSTYDILQDIAKVWKELSSMEQATIAEQLAGNRQQNVFFSIVEQFQEASSAMESMNNSSGELLKAYDKYSNSIQKHIDSFKAAYQSLSQTVINSSALRGLVDVGTGIINVLSVIFSILNKIGGIAPVITAVISTLLVKTFPAILASWSAVLPSLFTLPNAIVAGATVLIAAIAGIKRHIEEMRKEAEQAGSAMAKSFSENDSFAQKQISRINELKSSIESGTLSQSELYDAQSELLSIKGELVDAYGVEAEAIDILGASADEATNKIVGLNRELERNGANEYLTKYASQISTAMAEMGEVRTFIGKFGNGFTIRDQSTWGRVQKILEKYDNVSVGSYTKDYDWNSSEDFYTIEITADAREAQEVMYDLSKDFSELSHELAREGIDLNDVFRFDTESSGITSWEEYIGYGINQTDKIIDKWGEIYDNAILAKIANNNDYADVVNQFKEAERNYKNAVNGIYDTAEDRSKALEEALAGMDAAQILFQDTNFSADPQVKEYIDNLFKYFYEESEREKLRITFEADIKEVNKDSVKDNINGALASFADENGQFTKTDILIVGQQIESMDGATEAMNEQQLAYIELEEVAEQYGMTVGELLDVMVQLGVISSSATEGLDKQALGLINLSNELEEATYQINLYKKALEGGEKGDVASEYASAYKKFKEDMDAGKTGSNAVAAAVDLFFSDDMLAAMDYDLVRAAETLSGDMYQAIFSDDGDYGANFANYLRDTYGDAIEGVYQITDNGNGTFDISIESYEKLAECLGMDTNLFYALMDALDLYGPQAMLSGERTAELAEKLNLIGENAPVDNIDKVRAAIAGLATEFNTTDPVKIRTLLDSLASAGYIDLSQVDDLGGIIQEVLGEVESASGEEPTLTIDVDISGVESGVGEAQSLLDGIDGAVATTYIVTENRVLDSNGHIVPRSANTGGGSGSSNVNLMHRFASGTKDSPGGPALVNELGPELISDDGQAYIAGGGKPAIVNLSKHAIVLDADDTKRALGGVGGRILKGIPIKAAAQSIGYASSEDKSPAKYWTCPFCGTINPSTLSICRNCRQDPRKYKPSKVSSPGSATVPGKDVGDSGKSGGGGGGGGGGSSSGGSNGDNWFKTQLAEHKHAVEMDKETQKEYLDWLVEAYQKAYEEELIDLKEFRQYEEEIYNGRQEDFKDHLSDTEHLIELEKSGDNNPTVIFQYYQQMMADIMAELEKCYEYGLDSTNSYVQYLQNTWIKYNDTIKDLQDDASKEAKGQVKDLVDYRIKMLKQYLKNEIDNYKKRISYLKEFYDKQKELLQDEYDQEEYLEDQAEKRKAVADIQAELAALEYDDSAWAQKRKQKLLEELEDAEKDLGKFEKQHALELAQDELDKAYEAQVEELEAKIEELQAKLDNPKYLYETALEDVRNNSVALYEEMIAYNDAYGTGIQQDVVDMWEEAYKSLKRYYDLYGEYYNGINLVNATGYVEQPGDSSVVIPHGGYASGTRHASSGLHRVDELGAEYVFTSRNGNRYRMLGDGDKVLDAKSTNFLYKFATGGGKILSDMTSRAGHSPALAALDKMPGVAEIRMGDIIIQGNADERTVSEIRRAQREGINMILKEFNRLKK